MLASLSVMMAIERIREDSADVFGFGDGGNRVVPLGFVRRLLFRFSDFESSLPYLGFVAASVLQ